MMTISFALGGVFLICYVLYHLTNPANRFTGEGAVRYVYLFILIHSHRTFVCRLAARFAGDVLRGQKTIFKPSKNRQIRLSDLALCFDNRRDGLSDAVSSVSCKINFV